MKEERRKSAEERSEERPAAEQEPDGKDAETKKGGLDYVFKIAPADPKNAFNFEDVADK